MRAGVLASAPPRMSLLFYKVLHLAGIMLLFAALGAHALLAIQGGPPAEAKAKRRPLMIAHGVALLMILVAGFGLMARLGMASMPWPTWVWGKVGIWLVLGGVVALVRRQAGFAVLWVWILPLFGAVAAYLAVFKPS